MEPKLALYLRSAEHACTFKVAVRPGKRVEAILRAFAQRYRDDADALTLVAPSGCLLGGSDRVGHGQHVVLLALPAIEAGGEDREPLQQNRPEQDDALRVELLVHPVLEKRRAAAAPVLDVPVHAQPRGPVVLAA